MTMELNRLKPEVLGLKQGGLSWIGQLVDRENQQQSHFDNRKRLLPYPASGGHIKEPFLYRGKHSFRQERLKRHIETNGSVVLSPAPKIKPPNAYMSIYLLSGAARPKAREILAYSLNLVKPM